MQTHDHYMQRAIELARRAEGATSPNPLVGCVVVNNSNVVGEGWHRATGSPHAEIEALRAAGEHARGATLYVNLEPCSHHGRTPPCTEAIIAAEIKTVVYAIADPNPVASKGSTMLVRHGIEIIDGILNDEAAALNRFYFHHIKTGRPYVVAKFATSLDGRIATRTGNSQWITGRAARMRGHSLRQAVDAILIGAQTAINDDPQLTVRLPDTDATPENIHHPLRIILDGQARVPLDRQLLSGNLPGSSLVVTTDAMTNDHEHTLKSRGIDVLRSVSSTGTTKIDLNHLLAWLGDRPVQSVMVEGGQSVLGSFLDAGLIDEVWAFLAPLLIGGEHALSPIGGLGIDKLDNAPRLTGIITEQCGDDFLIQGQLDYSLQTA